MRIQNPNKYETSDFQLASFLLANNIKLLNIDKISNTRVSFVFENSKACGNYVTEYASLESSVEPITFASAQKKLKNLIYLKLKEV